MPRHDLLAAIDLGSNSFHLAIGRVVDGQIYPLDSLREVVRLGGGLTAEKRIDRATQARALEALAKFGERLRGFPKQAVRAVGTNTLRVAKNAPQFLREAREVLGFPIEVIAGREEARLIYVGVAHSLPAGNQRRLAVDIGGGSTEFIIGTGLDPLLTESLYMGCVSFSLKYFPDGRVDKARMKAAELAARQELSGIVKQYRSAGWQEAVGSSGTAKALSDLLAQNGFSDGSITRDGLDRLRSLLIKLEQADLDRLPGLRADRAPVLPGGLAIMIAVFDELGLESMRFSDGALRQGVLYDLLGRVEHRDMREATVSQFVRRYHVDPGQAERVRGFALWLYDSFVAQGEEADPDRLMLDWAARLSEVGLSIAHAQYHKHSAYVLSNADMPGFSRMEQQRLARLVVAHRGKLGKVQDAGLEGTDWLLVFALRLAALFMRSRSDAPLPPLRVAGDAAGFTIEVPQSWLDDNPLTGAALESESEIWRAVGMKLLVSAVSDRRAAQIAKIA
jgi:exopolyphosphatase / guanosine-5'-triphosphate,3'-diphosphate pyrophosphatase